MTIDPNAFLKEPPPPRRQPATLDKGELKTAANALLSEMIGGSNFNAYLRMTIDANKKKDRDFYESLSNYYVALDHLLRMDYKDLNVPLTQLKPNHNYSEYIKPTAGATMASALHQGFTLFEKIITQARNNLDESTHLVQSQATQLIPQPKNSVFSSQRVRAGWEAEDQIKGIAENHARNIAIVADLLKARKKNDAILAELPKPDKQPSPGVPTR